jgi:ABC-2 type transport system permease protein
MNDARRKQNGRDAWNASPDRPSCPSCFRLFSFRRAWAVSRKEFLHVLRDPRSLGMAIALPMLMLVLFGYALTLDVDRVPMVVWDRSGTQTSRDFVRPFAASRCFSIRGYVRDYRDVERAIDSREALMALVIPTDFARRLDAHRSAAAQLIVDGSDANTATLAVAYAEAVAQTYSTAVTVDALRRLGGTAPSPPLDFRPRVWYNTDLESKNYIVPGLIAVIMVVITALLTSLTVAREWERGTMEQLIATPLRGPELILGKLVPYWLIGMLDVLIAVLMGHFLFGVPLRGSAALLFGLSAVFLAGSLSLGILISVVARTQLVANQMALVATFLPSFLLSGFMYAISNMPEPIQVLTYVIPARYFIAVLRAIYLKGVGLEIIGLEAALLTLFGVVTVVLANVRFKKRLA